MCIGDETTEVYTYEKLKCRHYDFYHDPSRAKSRKVEKLQNALKSNAIKNFKNHEQK